MKKITILMMGFLFTHLVSAQVFDQVQRRGVPINISVFTESIGFPNFRLWCKRPNIGVRVGTELYYKQSEKRQLLQTVQLGYYNHSGFHQAFFISSEFGYRRYFGDFFADARVGLGYMLIDAALPRFKPSGDTFKEQKGLFGKVMPNMGLGTGYRFPTFSIFSRYEMFGEVPFGLNGAPALPHSAFHLGTRFSL